MRQIEFANSSFGLRLEWPSSWFVMDITGVTIRVTDLNGAELLAETAATLWTSDTIRLNGGVSAFGKSLTLEESQGGSVPALTTGDRLRIGTSADGPYEEVEVIAWDSTTDTAILDRDLRFDHADETTVVALWCTYDLDVSDEDIFPLNKQVVLHWSPDTDDLELTERGEIARAAFSFPGFEESFKTLYPYEYEGTTQPEHRLPSFLAEAFRQVSMDLRMRSMDINRLVDQELLLPTITSKVRWLILMSGDDRYDSSDQRDTALQEWQRQFETLAALPIWTDDNQDEIEQDSEVTTHEYVMQYRGL